jgi:hypothetical protein
MDNELIKYNISGNEVKMTKEEFDEKFDNGDIVQCDDCNEFYWSDDCWHSEEYDRMICTYCRVDNYHTCERCGCLIHSDDTWWWDDYTYCRCCYDDYCYEYEDSCSNIHGYHCGPSVKLLGNSDFRFGFEFEVNTDGDDNNFLDRCAGKVREILGEICNDIEWDGSVNSGFEIQTNPMDKEYYDNIGRAKIKEAMDYLKENGFANYDGDCGVHIHFTRKPMVEKAPKFVGELYILLNVFKDNVVKIAGREGIYDCSKPYFKDECTIDGYMSTVKLKKMVWDTFGDNRYQPINTCPSHTFEWRIFNGTTDFDKIDNYLKMAYGFNMAVMDHNYLGKTFREITGIDLDSEVISIDAHKERIFYQKDKLLKDLTKDVLIALQDMLSNFDMINNSTWRYNGLSINYGKMNKVYINAREIVEKFINNHRPNRYYDDMELNIKSVDDFNDLISDLETFYYGKDAKYRIRDLIVKYNNSVENFDKQNNNEKVNKHVGKGIGKDIYAKYLEKKVAVGTKIKCTQPNFGWWSPATEYVGTVKLFTPYKVIIEDDNNNLREVSYLWDMTVI